MGEYKEIKNKQIEQPWVVYGWFLGPLGNWENC